MTHPAEDDAAAWQDLSSELATEDVEQLEATAVERLAHGEPDALVAEALLADARQLAERKVAEEKFAQIARPADAIEVAAWHPNANEGDGWGRTFVGATRTIEPSQDSTISITIVGSQAEDGSARRELVVTTGSADTHLDAPSTRELIRALDAAATEIEQLQSDESSRRGDNG